MINSATRDANLIDVENPSELSKNQNANNTDDTTARVQQQVSDVVNQMRTNVRMIMERDERLETLKDRTESLSAGANQFSSQSRSAYRRSRWRNMRMNVIIGGIVVSLILIILLIIAVKSHSRK